MVYAGAFDSLILNRAVFFAPSDKYDSFIEHLLKYGAAHQEEKIMSVNSLFGDIADSVSIPEPPIPKAEAWNLILRLQKEKEVVGIYLSGHPLDDFKYEWENFATPLDKIEGFQNRKVNVAGFVSKAEHRISQKGTGWGRFGIQDYTGSLEIVMFSDTYARFKSFFEEGSCLYISGEYKQRFNSEEMEFRVQEVKLLETVGAEKTSSITLRIPAERITNELIEQIDNICKTHKGKHELKLEILDLANREKYTYTAVGRKVQVDNDLIEAIKLLGLETSVN